MGETFPTVLVLGRPAAGKSEVLDYLRKCTDDERRRRFHMGPLVELDDFPYVWQFFEEDAILQRHGQPRVWTDEKNYFTHPFAWNLLIEKVNLDYAKALAGQSDLRARKTTLVEFSRGGKRGWDEAFSIVSDEVCRDAAVLYIRVSYEESVRRNRARFRPGEAHSILYHSLPDDKMEFYYKESDWDALVAQRPGMLPVGKHWLPVAEISNEPEVTHDRLLLGAALDKSLGDLWARWRAAR